MPDGDTYSFYKTMEQSTLGMPPDCLDGCMYTKDGDVSSIKLFYSSITLTPTGR